MRSLVSLSRKSLVVFCRVLLILLALAFVFPSCVRGQSGSVPEFAWMGGSDTENQPGVYGAEFQFAESNAPGGRSRGATWSDQNGKLWLFGGRGYDASANLGEFNDLWVFDPAQGANGEWAWMGGSTTADQPGVYGAEFQFAAANVPGGRVNAATWTDANGRFWLFGGMGIDSAGNEGYLNDLWVFDRSQGTYGEWAWMGGSNTTSITFPGQPGVYGTEFQFAPSNIPGGRFGAVSWIDQSGKLWLFGGFGFDSTGDDDDLNDLWAFDPSQGTNGEWAWMGGGDTVFPPLLAVYGTQDQFDAANVPGGRDTAVAVADQNGRLRLFGGFGYSFLRSPGLVNEMWVFDPSQGTNGEWAWIGGSATSSDFGTEYQFADSNGPGARSDSVRWTDGNGRLWLFGGSTAEEEFDDVNDLWLFDPSQGTNGEWAWMGGTDSFTELGVYGTEFQFAASNAPGARDSAMAWTTPDGKFWLFGGYGINSTGPLGFFNDLWAIQPGVGTIAAATPSFSIAAGSYSAAQTVTISDATPGAAIYYTLDGSTPTTSSTVYSGAITISSSETLEAIAVANGDSTSAVASAVYTIMQTPAITWATPAPITYGTALSAAQLNATSTVAGTFTYTPPAGTVLAAGNQTLTTVFTPADSADYNVATASVVLVVMAPPGFTLGATSNSLAVTQGKTGTDTLIVTDQGGFNSSVKLSASGLPSGVTALFGTNPTTGSSVMTITASASAVPGTYAITVKGVSGSLSASTTIVLMVQSGFACHVGYTITRTWVGQFQVDLSINNTGTANITDWTLTWTFANGQTIQSFSNGNATQSSPNVTVTNLDYNGAIKAGGSYRNAQFLGTWNNVTNAVPTNFAVNGTACQ